MHRPGRGGVPVRPRCCGREPAWQGRRVRDRVLGDQPGEARRGCRAGPDARRLLSCLQGAGDRGHHAGPPVVTSPVSQGVALLDQIFEALWVGSDQVAFLDPVLEQHEGGAGGEGLGRSRGGFTRKIHLSADGFCRPLSLIVTPWQRADCTQFVPVLEKVRVLRLVPGRRRKKPDSVAADKAYSNGPCRQYLRRRGIRHVVPEKADSQVVRLRRWPRGGRPPGFDEERYKKRNTVERALNKLKNSRAVATRYDKRGYVFLGTVTTAALVIWLRT
ncbi:MULTISPECIES: IS5 family transposase [unclassified Streptomyces]|uniref:IS5 family transposase n=1 Tax=Streptomyces sp. HUAS CX7 TaxID=3062782 RepID=UPI0022781675|nr:MULTISPECIES: IS5 family transposase [unclassified Streptomyces]WKX23251.1 IS5 family transposase [Streptomyces sp. HUAS CX7]